MSETITRYPAAYTISGSINGTRYKNCIGKGSSTTATGNDYAKSSGSTATITYSFDFSDIPAGATIDSVEVKVGGHAESTTYNSSKKCEFQLYSGTTAKGEKTHFTSTSKQIITMTPGTWTRDELQSATLKVTIGYYGGLVNGVDFIVTYTVGASGPTCWMQIDGKIKAVAGLWKQVNGQIVEMDPSELDRTAKYFIKS